MQSKKLIASAMALSLVLGNAAGIVQDIGYNMTNTISASAENTPVVECNSAESVQSAIQNAESGIVTIVKLTSDIQITDSAITIPEDKVITLNLNGYKINGCSGKNTPATIHNYGTIVIDGKGDSETSGEINRQDANETEYNSYYTIMNAGTMTLQNVIITNGTSRSSIVRNGEPNKSNVVLNVEQGTVIESQGGAIALKNEEYNNPVININGGLIKNDVETDGKKNNAVVNYGKTTINGGEIAGNLLTTTEPGLQDGCNGGITIIEGGTFSGGVTTISQNPENEFTTENDKDNTCKIIINGGNFTSTRFDAFTNRNAIEINGGTFVENTNFDFNNYDAGYKVDDPSFETKLTIQKDVYDTMENPEFIFPSGKKINIDANNISFTETKDCTIVLPDNVTATANGESISGTSKVKTDTKITFTTTDENACYYEINGEPIQGNTYYVSVEQEDKSLTVNVVDHNYGDYVVDKQPTCTEEGSKSHHCTVCDTKTDETVIPATGHNMTKVEEKAPTCTESGHKTYWICANEEGVYFKNAEGTEKYNSIDETVIPATGHSYGEWVTTTKPTCTKDGEATRTCSVCGTTETKVIEAQGHKFSEDWTIDKEATCTEAGSKSHHCTICDAKKDVTTIDALGHKYNEWTVTKQPTCTETGTIKHICSVCGDFEYTKIDPIGHKYEKVETIAPTTNHEGYTVYKCTVCGEEKHDDFVAKIEDSSSNVDPSYDDNSSSTTDDSSNTNKPVTPVVTKAKIASATKIAAKTYTGKQIKPAVKVTSGKKVLKLNRDYTVKYGTNKIGKGTVTITGKGNYTGKIVKTFTIKPRKATIVLGTAKKKLVVRNAKRSEASKYQIQYSTNSKFKGAKTVNTKLTRKVLSAKSKKKYYVRARVIKTIGGKNYVGSWSAVKTIKVK